MLTDKDKARIYAGYCNAYAQDISQEAIADAIGVKPDRLRQYKRRGKGLAD